MGSIKAVAGAAPSLHICGNTTKLWEDMADTGASVLSLDDCVDLAEAKRRVGGRVALLGNIRPTTSMFLGTPADVEENAKECLRKAWDCPKGYILGMGCGLPIDTPPVNILALIKAARRHGQYARKPCRRPGNSLHECRILGIRPTLRARSVLRKGGSRVVLRTEEQQAQPLLLRVTRTEVCGS